MIRFVYNIFNYGYLCKLVLNFYNYTLTNEISENEINSFIHKIIPCIENCGCVCIKFAQWLTPILDLLYNTIDNEPYWLKKLERFYENCKDHSLDYTLSVYKQEFNDDFDTTYKIIDIIGSGSIGQVYKIQHNYTKRYYAMKVLHPNVHYDMWLIKFIFRLLMMFSYTKQVIYNILPYDMEEYLDIFSKQLNLINEGNNLCLMNHLYKHNSMVVFPDMIRCSQNILIMSYEYGIPIDSSDKSEYEKMKVINILSLFSKNNFEINNFNHGDIHKGNWKITKDNKLLLYDLGYCWKLREDKLNLTETLYTALQESNPGDFKQLHQLIYDMLDIKDKKYKDYVVKYVDKHVNHRLTDTGKMFKLICNVAKEMNIYVIPEAIQGLIMHMQTEKYWTKYSINNINEKFENDNNIYRRDYLDLYIFVKRMIFSLNYKLHLNLN